jgi:nitrite reductase/ring-hydroxylating ferredoxin subunit/uncharacterized membrane protein
MRSRAHFKSHPLHPILIAFPIAFIPGCLIADAVGKLLHRPGLQVTGSYLSIAAIATGLIAAIPGLIDYLTVIPPNSTAKKRATQHMLINVTAIALIAVGCAFRNWHTRIPGWPTILLELASLALVSWGGWLGGTLVYRNQIAVDHRYAHAGKWQELHVEGAPGQTITIEAADQMKSGQMRLLHWNGRRIVLARTAENAFAAFDDHCTHRGGPLADGVLICNTVQCPWHGSQFNVTTGQVQAGPAEKPINTYKAELRDGQVQLTLPTDQPRPSTSAS